MLPQNEKEALASTGKKDQQVLTLRQKNRFSPASISDWMTQFLRK